MTQIKRSQLLIISVFLLLQNIAHCQDDKLNTFSNKQLGIQFRYKNTDEFDNRKELSSSGWRDTSLFSGQVHLKIPTGFFAEVVHPRKIRYTPPCNNSPLRDSMVVISQNVINSGAIRLYFVSGDFRHIAYTEGFFPIDSEGLALDIFRNESSNIDSAIENYNWASLVRQGMTEKATIIHGSVWKGLRGSNSTAQDDESGYAAFIICEFTDGCFLVCSYYDSPMEEKNLGESDFYDIVATIDFPNKH